MHCVVSVETGLDLLSDFWH